MPAPPVLANDAARVAALRRFAILDTPPETAFDELVETAARVCETPTALVTFVDEKRQWFKARFGFAPSEIERALAFCAYTITQHELVEVPDARLDTRFMDNPLVTGEPRIRFYAGAPLVAASGHALGSLAVIDYRPRTLTDGQRKTLRALANQVMAQLELRHMAANKASALARRDRYISALLESALDAIVVMDHQGKLVELNPVAVQTFGIERDAALGNGMAELMIPPRLRDDHRRGLAAYLATGQQRILGRRIETTAQRSDGSEFPVELAITRLGSEDPPIFAGFLRDLTERRRTEAELLESMERFELVVRATQDVIGEWDLPTDRVHWTDDLAAWLGYAPEELVPSRETWLRLIHDEDRVAHEESLRRELERRGAYWSGEYRLRRRDGTYAQVWVRAYITYAPDGHPLRMIGALTDMSARRRLEEQLVRSQKMEAIGQLSSGLAHDFNNLLTIIQCNAFLLGETVTNEPATYVKDILHATERAATLTRQLLLLGRKQRLRETTVDLNQFVMDLIPILDRTLTARIQVMSSLDPFVPAIRADASMLEQVLLNLAINARDAMEEGGTITVSTSRVVLDAPYVRHGLTAAPGVYACLSVADTGAGIAPETLPQIFEPFFTTKDIGRGTGLGLSTVYHIVKQHHGWLDVSATVGEGATFVIALPAAGEAEPRAAPRFASGEVPTGTETILVVEDELLLRERISRLLRQYGYAVIECESGPAALALWRTEASRVDLVLSDLVMPGGLDGRQLVQQLRDQRADLRVIYTSGFSPEHAGQGEPLVDGVNFLEKPYAPSKLLQLIRQQLDRK